jgi:hypothetical protein
MSLLELWRESPEQLKDKEIQQLISFAGAGKLVDESDCSRELRAFLARIPSSNLVSYADQCLSKPFSDSGIALQDVVNEVGSRLGAEVISGRYRGRRKQIGFDGLWRFPNGQSIVVEVKTTDTYRIDLNTIAGYRRMLIDSNEIVESRSSILLVVGRQDTGDLEAQIRGSRYAWDVRIISVGALLRLMSIKEGVDDPQIIERIHNILIPREFTRLDEIADVLFSAAEDIKQDSDPQEDNVSTEAKPDDRKLKPKAFHDACIARIQKVLKTTLVKRTRAQYSSPDKSTLVLCAVSKEHDPDTRPNYWFGFHPHQKESLEHVDNAYVGLGCGDSTRVLLIPFSKFAGWLKGMWKTQKDDRHYWHVVVHRKGATYLLYRKEGQQTIDLTKFLLNE